MGKIFFDTKEIDKLFMIAKNGNDVNFVLSPSSKSYFFNIEKLMFKIDIHISNDNILHCSSLFPISRSVFDMNKSLFFSFNIFGDKETNKCHLYMKFYESVNDDPRRKLLFENLIELDRTKSYIVKFNYNEDSTTKDLKEIISISIREKKDDNDELIMNM